MSTGFDLTSAADEMMLNLARPWCLVASRGATPSSDFSADSTNFLLQLHFFISACMSRRPRCPPALQLEVHLAVLVSPPLSCPRHPLTSCRPNQLSYSSSIQNISTSSFRPLTHDRPRSQASARPETEASSPVPARRLYASLRPEHGALHTTTSCRLGESADPSLIDIFITS